MATAVAAIVSAETPVAMVNAPEIAVLETVAFVVRAADSLVAGGAKAIVVIEAVNAAAVAVEPLGTVARDTMNVAAERFGHRSLHQGHSQKIHC